MQHEGDALVGAQSCELGGQQFVGALQGVAPGAKIFGKLVRIAVTDEVGCDDAAEAGQRRHHVAPQVTGSGVAV